MRASIIIATHQEGDRLRRTIESCVETTTAIDREIVVADDASTDGSVEEAIRHFPQVRVFRNQKRQGASPTKALGAGNARGDVLVFLDGHTKPEFGAIVRLVEDIEQLEGQAVVTPKVVALDCDRWTNDMGQAGHGYHLDLDDFSCGWLGLGELRMTNEGGKRFFESPALIGCALALSRRLYEKLWGFDSRMRFWGVEDLDFGLKCWLLGHRILHDPEAVVGHRFRNSFDNFLVPAEHVIANQLRMARKSLTLATWSDWVDRCRGRHPGRPADHPEGLWALAWQIFEAERASVEQERSYLLGHRVRDEFWFAERFALTWPRLASESRAALRAALTQPLASPSPPPCTAQIFRDTVVSPDPDRNVLPGDIITLVVACDQEDLTDITWKLPSFTLADYQADDDQAVMTEVTEIHDTEVQFFFMKPGDGQTVSVTAVAEGRQVMASTAFNVKKPIITLAGIPPTPQFDYPIISDFKVVGPNKIQLTRDPTWPLVYDGFNCEATVDVPAGFGFAQGEWAFWQVVLIDRAVKYTASGNCDQAQTKGTFELDTVVPYTGPQATGVTPLRMGDSPGQGSLDLFSYFKMADVFNSYIMFKSGNGPSRWVSLAMCSWEANVCAKHNGVWAIITQSTGTTPMGDEYIPPVWTSNAKNTKYAPVSPCPDFC